MADIKGIEGLTVADVHQQVRQGAKFVTYGYCISLLVVTLRRTSDVHFVKAGESAVGGSVPYILLSLLLGWWGFPWGLIYTPMVVVQNLSGGTDVTGHVLEAIGADFSHGGAPEVRVE